MYFVGFVVVLGVVFEDFFFFGVVLVGDDVVEVGFLFLFFVFDEFGVLLVFVWLWNLFLVKVCVYLFGEVDIEFVGMEEVELFFIC